MLKEVFQFPQHNESKGCCFLCKVKPDGIRETGSNAAWRFDRLDYWSCLERMRSQGRRWSSLFWAPGITLLNFKLDWLHIVDLGVGADWLGQLFSFLLPFLEGVNKGQRVDTLWKLIQAHYKEMPNSAKLDDLTDSMIKGKHLKAPKLKANAAECRGLVPIGARLASDLLSSKDSLQQSVKQASQELNACYECLDKGPDSSALASHCRRFCTLWVALEAVQPDVFRVKPKMHMFQELCEMSGPTRPAAHWTYRDEDFGGSMVAMARRRGGRQSPASTGHRLLQHFRGRYPFPDFQGVKD